MDIKYNHIDVEKDKNKKWIDKKYFSTHDLSKKPFSIILPPPNVTGKLHLGHAWDGYIQDTIIRYKKLSNFDVLFLPGTDHAGIATQIKIEQKLQEMNLNKYDIGREEFLKHAYKWKDEYSGIIHEQWKKLGLALDYDNERFTLDESSNEFVNKTFIDLYNKGIIYRGINSINWDPKLKTAISNIEVISKPTKSKMYYVKYFFENSKEFIIVATTRIETMFSDVAIAINPNDKSKSKLVGNFVINPLTNKKLPIIFDDYIDINLGTGFMKVSAHATNDIDIIKKNNLEIIECIGLDGLMNKNAMFTENLTRNEAREKVFNFLKQNNFIEKVEDITNNVSYSERSNEVIEILVMPQWFVKMDKLSKLVLENLNKKDKVKFFPKRFENVLRKWMENAYDWTISRQLWWGHQIPAWYKNGQIKVQVNSPGEGWVRDEDVLDTWFSSGLVPLSFLNWSKKNGQNLNRYFPTSLLVTGYDIIFFWVARMYFFSLYFENNIPFQNLLIHGLIRDQYGRKMSKSLGNGIDPMEIIDKYGSDSLRWYLLTNSSPGQDINFLEEKLIIAWSLCNKLWNISRYIKNLKYSVQEINDSDIWIVDKLINLKKNIDKKIEKYEFSIIGKEITKFIYDDFSSWYIEFSKVNTNKKICLLVLKNLLLLLHPFLPFLTDHLYFELFNSELLENKFELKSLGKEERIDIVIDVVSLIRESRNIYNISNKEIVEYKIREISDEKIIVLVNKLANAKYCENEGALFTKNNISINVNLSEKIKKTEKKKTELLLKKIEDEIKRSKLILNNKGFINKAPKEKIQIEKDKYKKYKEQYEKLKNKLNIL